MYKNGTPIQKSEYTDIWYSPNFFADEHKIWYELIDTSVNWKQFEVIIYGKKIHQPRDSFYMDIHINTQELTDNQTNGQ